MVSNQQDSGDLGPRKAHDPFPPLSLEGRCRIPVFIGIAGKYDAVHRLIDRSIYDLVKRLQEVHYPEGKPGFRVLPAVVGHINV